MNVLPSIGYAAIGVMIFGDYLYSKTKERTVLIDRVEDVKLRGSLRKMKHITAAGLWPVSVPYYALRE